MHGAIVFCASVSGASGASLDEFALTLLAALGIDAEPAVYDEAFANEVHTQLLAADGVLVWVDPIHQGKARAALDPLLGDVASHGLWVSAHPDVILKVGAKEVLHRSAVRGTTLAFAVAAPLAAASAQTVIFGEAELGSPPREFEFGRTGQGSIGEWKIVEDKTAVGERALAQISPDRTDYRFPLAAYGPIAAKDVEATVQFKPVAGTVDQAGGAEGGGSGWVILSYSPRDKRLINQWAADHTTNLAGGRPVLVLDMYEHAYHMDYGVKAAAYVDAYMEAIRWKTASSRYAIYSREG